MKNKNVRLIVRTAVMLALLVVLQAATKAAGQFVTGSCVNAVLAVSAWMCGVWDGRHRRGRIRQGADQL